ncbi:MAG: hypothetical protein GX228_10380 [Firmicutes bacterium]|nr:hypothetical protein [Bacillota bacterium]
MSDSRLEFIRHVGLGSNQGEAWMPSPGPRLMLDVMIPAFTKTFTWEFDRRQECLIVKHLISYRDWVEQVIGHNMQQSYHLVLLDNLLERDDIAQYDPNKFWLSPANAWKWFDKFEIDPKEYDLVWCLWAWKNREDASQMYGGGALPGPDDVPFMSFSVQQFGKEDQGITMVLEHEAQHTYEQLFHNTGQTISYEAPITGFPFADHLDILIEEIVRLEPGVFEPFMSDEEALQHKRGGPKRWPGMNLQRAVNAWTHRQQDRNTYLEIAKKYGRIVPAREDLVIEPLFGSVTVVTDRPSRDVYLPVRVCHKGEHIPAAVTVRLGDEVIPLLEDSYYRMEGIRMPQQERWRIGWDGHSYYGGWVTVNKDSVIVLTVTGSGFEEVFEIPVVYRPIRERK